MTDNVIIYEQPLNEIIRVCLRLEQLFIQLDHHAADTSVLGTHNVMATLISLLSLLDRPDLKAKLAKELSHYVVSLERLQNTPHINHHKLEELLTQLNNLSRCFIDSSGKIGQNVRELELINNLRLHLATPGGGCSFDLPVYHYWLRQPLKQRQDLIQSWISEFNNTRLATSLILKILREGTKVQSKTAEKGFYQEMLDPQTNLRLIRISVPIEIPAYPEISSSRHFISIRFFSPSLQARSTQYLLNLPFWLFYCG